MFFSVPIRVLSPFSTAAPTGYEAMKPIASRSGNIGAVHIPGTLLTISMHSTACC